MDRAIVDRARQGDIEAFDVLARSIGDRCMSIASRILRDADLAEDAVQAALIIAWRDLHRLRDPDRFEPWIHRILTRACYATARRRRVLHEIRIEPGVDAAGPDDRQTIHDRDQLERGFRRLTVEQRAVLVFHHYVGLPVAEIADQLGIPVGTVKSRLHHATTAHRASLDADARGATIGREQLA